MALLIDKYTIQAGREHGVYIFDENGEVIKELSNLREARSYVSLLMYGEENIDKLTEENKHTYVKNK